ncbi:MAG TPA: type VII secretion target [Egibacteraceae bacterium]
MSGFTADPDAIAALGEVFGDAAQEVADSISGFESRARDVADAFGWLGPSEEMYRDYQCSVGEAVEGLQGVAALLAEAQGILAATAANYEGSDQGPQEP